MPIHIRLLLYFIGYCNGGYPLLIVSDDIYAPSCNRPAHWLVASLYQREFVNKTSSCSIICVIQSKYNAVMSFYEVIIGYYEVIMGYSGLLWGFVVPNRSSEKNKEKYAFLQFLTNSHSLDLKDKKKHGKTSNLKWLLVIRWNWSGDVGPTTYYRPCGHGHAWIRMMQEIYYYSLCYSLCLTFSQVNNAVHNILFIK